MTAAHRQASGFTLIEMAIVLFIGSLLISGILGISSSLIASAQLKATNDRMKLASVALRNFVARTGRLPCPGNYTLADTDANFGTETPTTGVCTGAIDLGPGLAKYGTLPWKTIGLDPQNAFDGWNNQFAYAVTTTATSTSFTALTAIAMKGRLTVHTDAPPTTGLPATGNQINACSTTAGDNTCNLFAAVVIISHGPNGFGAYTRTGGALPKPTSARELVNPNVPAGVKTDVAFVNAAYSEATATYFDDVVMALSPADLLVDLLAQGGVKSEATMLAQKFSQLVAGLAADAVSNRSGSPGNRSYPLSSTSSNIAYTLTAANFNGNCDSNPPNSVGIPNSSDMQLIKDPWGNAFRYQRATNSVNSGESCPTYAVFVSAGPDGNIATTADNSVYYASKGELDAIFSLSGW